MKSDIDNGRLGLLYVEDDPDTRELISRSLAEEYPDLALHVAAGGAEGLELFREHRPELVITDIRMPGMDGLRMASEIKAIDREIEVIALTAYSETDFLLSAVELGFSHYVLKPIDFDRLFGAIDKTLQGLNLKRQVNEQNDQIRQFAAVLEKRVEARTSELEASKTEIEHRNTKLRELTRELKVSRDRYWNLYNWSPIGYLSLDEQFVIREINIMGARMLGSRRASLLGTSIEQYLTKENMAVLVESFKDCVQAKHAMTELRMTIQETKHLFVQLHCVPYTRNGKDLKLYRTAIIDITKLKEAEDKLYRLNRLYSVLSATGKAIVHATGKEELFQEICRIAVQEGGFKQACLGMADIETGQVHPVAIASSDEGNPNESCICFRENFNEPGPVATAIRQKGYFISNDCANDPNAGYLHSIGQQYGLNSMAAFAIKRKGEPVGAFSISAGEANYFDQQMTDLLNQLAADISFALKNMEQQTRRREAEEALHRETLEKLNAVQELRSKEQMLLQQSRMAAMGEMLGNIAHQWRQPLNLLGLKIQQLGLSCELGDFSKELLDANIGKAMEIVQHLSQTIDDFRNLSLPDREKILFRLDQVVAKSVSLVEESFKEQRIAIKVSTTGEPQINGKPNEFGQVLLNILMNARDAFQKGETSDARITMRSWTENGRAVVTITDNAGGVKEEILGKIFDAYFTTKELGEGTGVGLFMSKIIIEKNMGGRLTVRNVEDGAEFRIEV